MIEAWTPPAPLFTFQRLCQFLLQNISSATALRWKSCCIRICAQVVKSVFHRIEIARLNRNTSYLMLLADGPSVNISIMEFRAHSQKFANSSQHQAKLNNAVALELWKGDMFSNIRADWLFTAWISAGLNCWILIQEDCVAWGDIVSVMQAWPHESSRLTGYPSDLASFLLSPHHTM